MNFFSSLEGSVGSKHPINLCCDFMIVIKPFNHRLKEMGFSLLNNVKNRMMKIKT